jgi:hypothetical protein
MGYQLFLWPPVAQFLEFGCTLVSKSKQIYTSGTSLQQAETESATKRLLELSRRISVSTSLNNPSRILSVQDRNLQTICDGCISISNELLQKLELLKVQDNEKFRQFKCIRQALKSVWSKRAVDDISNHLDAFRREMDGHVLVSIRYVPHSSQDKDK